MRGFTLVWLAIGMGIAAMSAGRNGMRAIVISEIAEVKEVQVKGEGQ